MTPLGGPWPSVLHPFSQRVLLLPHGLLLLFVIWTLVWKGLALWRAARAGQTAWFVVLLVVNTGGLLEIAYLLFFAPRRTMLPAPGHPEAAGPIGPYPSSAAGEESPHARP